MLRDILKPAIALFTVCLIVALSLAFTNNITKDKILERAAIDSENARREVLVGAASFEEIDRKNIPLADNAKLNNISEVYRGITNDEVIGYVFSVTGNGYGGDMKIMVGIDLKGTITGVKITENKETPGLGTKAADEPFISQFTNINPQNPLQIVKTKKSKDEEIQAISGATITSRAVTEAVQSALDASVILSGKEKAE